MSESGFVMFRLGERVFATPLDEVREIVRLQDLQTLPGAQPPLAGILVLRGVPLPVLDVRGPEAPVDRGDVLVVARDGEVLGVAVDAVAAVLHPDELPPADSRPGSALPSYVVDVRRGPAGPVLLVDLRLLLDTTAAGWSAAATAVAAV